MKRGFQFVALLIVSLLAGAHVLAGFACAMQPVAGSDCPMGMSNMASDCPMSHMSVQECPMGCCARSQRVVVSQDLVFLKQRHVVEPLAVPNGVTDRAQRELAVADMSARETSSPPVYILNRVFRI
jgi:hypothetical protein